MRCYLPPDSLSAIPLDRVRTPRIRILIERVVARISENATNEVGPAYVRLVAQGVAGELAREPAGATEPEPEGASPDPDDDTHDTTSEGQ